MVTFDEIESLALSFGFDRIAFADISPTETPQGIVHPQAASLKSDPTVLMPEARSVLVAAMGYRPYRYEPGRAAIDSYYVTGNIAHTAAGKLAEALREKGLRTLMTSELRVKPLAMRSGLGYMGRNGLIAVHGFGTRVSLQTIITDWTDGRSVHSHPSRLDERCLTCGQCLSACPTHALKGDGSLDISKCLRAQPESDALPVGMRRLIGNSLLGCDICQRSCPRNDPSDQTAMPDDLADVLSLPRLLAGDYKGLIPWLGKNNARKMRLLNRAVLAVLNEKRYDLLPFVESLSTENNAVGEHARWALQQMTACESHRSK